MFLHQHPIVISTTSPPPVKGWMRGKKATASAALINQTHAKVGDMYDEPLQRVPKGVTVGVKNLFCLGEGIPGM